MAEHEEACFGCGEFACDGNCKEPEKTPEELEVTIMQILDLFREGLVELNNRVSALEEEVRPTELPEHPTE